MKANGKPALVPKLRFPEFRETQSWEETRLAEVLSPILRKKRKPTEPYTGLGLRSHGKGTFLKRLADPEKNAMEDLYEVKCNDLVVNITFAWEGAVAIAQTSDEGALVSHRFPTYTFEKGRATPEFFRYVILDKLFIYKLGVISPGGAGRNRVLSKNDFLKLSVLLPELDEQQKIADCLGSVDDLIAAQARKLDALKTHKKGLMQQLFPREGETQPRLRFLEFQNAGEWEVRTIGEMFSLINGCAFKPEDWKPAGTPIIRIQNLNDPSAEFNYSQAPVPERNRVESGDLLFAWSGTLGSSFGARIWNGPSGVLNQHIFKVLMDEQQITLQFALLVLARVEEDIARRTHGFKASFVHVKKSDLVQVELLLPSVPEQRRIADCLSSLDALITAQTEKLEALRTHKKALMQQLFPSTKREV